MLYCFDTRMNFDYTEYEIELAKTLNCCIFYDLENDLFLDANNNVVDINKKIIFPRTGCSQIYDINAAIERFGGAPISSNEDVKKVENWPLYYKTKRKTLTVNGSSLLDKNFIAYLRDNFGEEVFFKTAEKNFSYVIPISLLEDPECAFYKAIKYHLDDTFIVSEKVDILSDSFGLKEYRCFVINNEIYNISRMTDNVLHRVEFDILKKAREIVKQMNGIFPTCYVIDLMVYSLNDEVVIDVVEFNSAHASGLYLYNSCIAPSDDLLHQIIYNVAPEFARENYHLLDDGKFICERSINYGEKNSFAGDLRSIRVTGDRGLAFSDLDRLSIDDFKSHKALQQELFESAVELKSDADLLESESREEKLIDMPDELRKIFMKELSYRKKY